MSQTRGFHDEGDPTVSDFVEWNEQSYVVKQIVRFITKDEQDLPVFKPDKFSNDMVARMNLLTEGHDDDGPPWTATRTDIILYLQALGCDIKDMPEGDTTAFLLEAQKRSTVSNTNLVAHMGTGKWIKYIEGTRPPANLYTFQFMKAYSPDRSEPVQFVKGNPIALQNGGSFIPDNVKIILRIVGDVQGRPSLYNGFEFITQLNNPFDEPKEVEGQLKLNMKTTKAGGRHVNVRNFYGFLDAFWPQAYDHEWVADPTISELGVDEVRFPMQVVNQKALAHNGRAVGYLKFTEKGYAKVNFEELQAVGSEQQQAAASQQHPDLLGLIDLIEKYAKVVDPVPPNGVWQQSLSDELTFTSEGIEWCKQNLGPIWDSIENFPEVRNVALLDAGQIAALCKALDEKYGKAEPKLPSLADEQGF